MAFSKAKIIVEGKQKSMISVLFNPNEYILQTQNKFSWHNIPGLQSPIAQFVSGEAATLTMDLFFDSSADGSDVRSHTQKVVEIMDVERTCTLRRSAPFCGVPCSSGAFLSGFRSDLRCFRKQAIRSGRP